MSKLISGHRICIKIYIMINLRKQSSVPSARMKNYMGAQSTSGVTQFFLKMELLIHSEARRTKRSVL